MYFFVVFIVLTNQSLEVMRMQQTERTTQTIQNVGIRSTIMSMPISTNSISWLCKIIALNSASETASDIRYTIKFMPIISKISPFWVFY